MIGFIIDLMVEYQNGMAILRLACHFWVVPY